MSMYGDLFARLSEAGVRYVVVGGVAVVLHGYARLTADVDLVIALEPENVRRAIETLQAHGLRPLLPVNALDFADDARRREWVESRHLEVFSMRDERNPLLTVDLFAREPIPFEELASRAIAIDIDGHPVNVASIDDLIAMKRTADRPQDRLDIEKLQEIARRRRR